MVALINDTEMDSNPAFEDVPNTLNDKIELLNLYSEQLSYLKFRLHVYNSFKTKCKEIKNSKYINSSKLVLDFNQEIKFVK